MTRREFMQRTSENADVLGEKIKHAQAARGAISADATMIAVMLQLIGEQLCDLEAAIRSGKVVNR